MFSSVEANVKLSWPLMCSHQLHDIIMYLITCAGVWVGVVCDGVGIVEWVEFGNAGCNGRVWSGRVCDGVNGRVGVAGCVMGCNGRVCGGV